VNALIFLLGTVYFGIQSARLITQPARRK